MTRVRSWLCVRVTDCLREARCTVKTAKPISLVYDPIKGGAKLELVRDAECPAELRGPIFDGRGVITWHRLKDVSVCSSSVPTRPP